MRSALGALIMDPTLAVVIAHFSPRGAVAGHLYQLLKHLATLTTRIVFVSTAISAQEIARISPFAQVVARENFGYDFWSYRLGIEALGDRSGLQRLILCNSSFVTLDARILCSRFLSSPLRPALRGISASAENQQWHAQSYWIAFEHDTLISSPDFEQWWAEMQPVSDRAEVIQRYEIGMSARFAALGVPVLGAFEPTMDDLLVAACRAIETRYWRISTLSRSVNLDLDHARALNPTHFLWDRLLEQFAVVKLELLRTNPFGMNLTRLHSQTRTAVELAALIRDAMSS
jgi:rhamnosyltransferase